METTDRVCPVEPATDEQVAGMKHLATDNVQRMVWGPVPVLRLIARIEQAERKLADANNQPQLRKEARQ